MQKVILVTLLGAAALACLLTACDSSTNDEDVSDLSDEIIAVIDKSTPVSSGNLITKTNTDKNGDINIEYYDNNDNLVEQYVWNDDSEVSHVVMTYSNDSLMMTKEEISPDKSSNVIYSYQYADDNTPTKTTVSEFENGFLLKTTEYDNNENIVSYSVYSYDESDNLLKVENYNADGTLSEYFTYEYNSDNLRSKYSTFSADGTVQKYTVFEYNSNLKLSEEAYYDGNGSLEYKFVYEYYESGNKKSSVGYDSEGNMISSDEYQDTE